MAYKVTLEVCRQKFPIAATVLYKGKEIGTVCGYVKFPNGEYEVKFVTWAILPQYNTDGRKIGQFTPRSYNFKSKAQTIEASVIVDKAAGRIQEPVYASIR